MVYLLQRHQLVTQILLVLKKKSASSLLEGDHVPLLGYMVLLNSNSLMFVHKISGPT